MERSRKLMKIDDIINNILRNSNLSSSFKIMRLKRKWENIVGKQMAEHTSPHTINASVLTVSCDHPGWINNLQLLKNEILKNIRENFENEMEIKDIRFVLNKASIK